MFKDQIKCINCLLLHIKLYWSVNIYYSFWIESPKPHENIIWDLIWENGTSDLIWEYIIWDRLIYKIADDITCMWSPIRSDVWNTHIRSHMIFTRGKMMKNRSLIISRVSAATTPAWLLRQRNSYATYRPSTWGMGHLQTYLPSNGIIILYDGKNDERAYATYRPSKELQTLWWKKCFVADAILPSR